MNQQNEIEKIKDNVFKDYPVKFREYASIAPTDIKEAIDPYVLDRLVTGLISFSGNYYLNLIEQAYNQ